MACLKHSSVPTTLSYNKCYIELLKTRKGSLLQKNITFASSPRFMYVMYALTTPMTNPATSPASRCMSACTSICTGWAACRKVALKRLVHSCAKFPKSSLNCCNLLLLQHIAISLGVIHLAGNDCLSPRTGYSCSPNRHTALRYSTTPPVRLSAFRYCNIDACCGHSTFAVS